MLVNGEALCFHGASSQMTKAMPSRSGPLLSGRVHRQKVSFSSHVGDDPGDDLIYPFEDPDWLRVKPDGGVVRHVPRSLPL